LFLLSQLSKDRERHFVSLLTHFGGLTYRPPIGSIELTIPNSIARQRIGEWVSGARASELAYAQDQFLLHDDAEPILQLIDSRLNSSAALDVELQFSSLLNALPPHHEYAVEAGKHSRTARMLHVCFADVIVRGVDTKKLWVFELRDWRARDHLVRQISPQCADAVTQEVNTTPSVYFQQYVEEMKQKHEVDDAIVCSVSFTQEQFAVFKKHPSLPKQHNN
jgi:hypothetical protein